MKRVHLYLDPELLKTIAVLAKEDRRSMSSYIEVLIKEHLKSKGFGKSMFD